ncbi:MAG: TlpA disulfide reductase family protein [Opitutaceae bacterium]
MKPNTVYFRQAFALLVTAMGALCFSPAITAGSEAGGPRSFDDAWKELETIKATRANDALAATERARRISRLALDIFEGYPKDVRRWRAAVEVMRSVSGYVYEMVGDPEKEGAKAFLRDTAAREAWNGYARALYAQCLVAPDVPSEMVRALVDAYGYRLNMTQGSSLDELRAVIDEFARRFPGDPKQISYEQLYYMRLQQSDPGAAVDYLQRLLLSDNVALRAMAEGKLRIATGKVVDLKFTALDGREVDFEKLRGKVVLVDFWATWCGPCIAELPNIKNVYAKYHDQGFEIVGVSLDLDRDRQKLVDFCRDQNLPWPQHFDGGGWKNEFAVRFAVSAVPAMLLLDTEGKVVSTQARGSRLEAEVKRLLKL